MKKRLPALILAVFMLANVFAFTTAAVDETALEPYHEADILDLRFSDKNVENVAGSKIVKSVGIVEYSAGGSARASFTNFGKKNITIGNKTYNANVFYKNEDTNTMMISFAQSTETYRNALADGFTLEAAFDVPKYLSGGTYWGPDAPREANAVVSSMNGGGYVIAVSHKDCPTGKAKIYFSARNADTAANVCVVADGLYSDGEHIFVTAQLDKVNSKIKIFINGELKGEKAFTGAFGLAAGANAPYLAVGGSISSSTNPTGYKCSAPLNLSTLKLRSDVLTESAVAAAYAAELAKLGDPVSVSDEADKTGDSIIKLLLAKNANVYADEHSLGAPEIKEYSGTAVQSGFAGVGEVTLKVEGKEVKTVGFTKSAKNDIIGIKMSSFASSVVSELENGFSVETGFVVPSGLSTSGYNYFVGAANNGGFGICSKDGKLCFVINDGEEKSVATDMPAVGTFCHVIGIYDNTAKTITMWLNGNKVGTTSVSGFDAGSWSDIASIGLGGTAASDADYTANPAPAGTIITGLDVHANALTEQQAKEAYEVTMAKLGFSVVVRHYDDDFEPVLRFLVTSDVHISSASDARAAKLAGALSDAYSIARDSGNHYKKLDAVEVIGDIADNGTEAQMSAAKSVFDAGIDYDETQLLVTMGNHDYYEGNSASTTPWVQEDRFDTAFSYANDTLAEGAQLIAEDRAPNTHYVINGYHFINLSVDGTGWTYTESKVNWLKEQLDAAVKDTGADKPIFVFHHIGEVDTVIGTDHYGGDPGIGILTELLESYPQVVDFSGHSHHPINTPFALLQEGCTMVGTGTLKTAGTLYANGASMQEADGVSLSDVSQVLVVEVDKDSRTRIRVYDTTKNKFMSQSWMLESYNPKDFVYTRNYLKDGKILFDDDAKLNITKVTKSLVSFNFDTISAKSDFLPNAFLAEILDSDGNVVSERYLRWAYYDEDFDAVLETAMGGLTPDTEYKLRVRAVSSLYERDPVRASKQFSENCLEKTFKTLPDSDAPLTADILNTSIGTNSISDASGKMTATVSGSPVYAYDDTIGMNTIKFPANSSYVKFADYKDVANAMSYGFTVEAYFKIDEFNCDASSSKSPMGSQQSGGFGFDIKPNNQVLYSVYTAGYKTLTKTQDAGKFYHWVGVYDGDTLTCYVNGHKIGTLPAPAPMTFIGTDAQAFYLGADVTGTGGAERQARTTVAFARMYSQPANETQALNMWKEVRALQDTKVYPGDDDDPEYLLWSKIDELDTQYVTIYDPHGEVHDHANDDLDVMYSGTCVVQRGAHLYSGSSHDISGGLRAKIAFTGTAFRYVVQYRGPAGQYAGSVDVYVDGAFYKTVTGLNANNSTSRYVALEILGLKDKKHEITLISHDGTRFVVDLFEVVFGTGKDEDGKPIPEIKSWNIIDCTESDYITYYTPTGTKCDITGFNTDGQTDSTATWQFFNGSHLQNSTGIFGNYADGAYFTIKFKGTGIRYVTQFRGPVTADIDVYIDGVYADTVTGLSANNDTTPFTVYENTSLSDGEHTVKFVASGSGQMPFDYLEIYGEPVGESDVLKGDTDGNGKLESDDAIYLLYSVFFPTKYPANQNYDFDGNGKVESDDAIYLLYHIFFPTKYELK